MVHASAIERRGVYRFNKATAGDDQRSACASTEVSPTHVYVVLEAPTHTMRPCATVLACAFSLPVERSLCPPLDFTCVRHELL